MTRQQFAKRIADLILSRPQYRATDRSRDFKNDVYSSMRAWLENGDYSDRPKVSEVVREAEGNFAMDLKTVEEYARQLAINEGSKAKSEYSITTIQNIQRILVTHFVDNCLWSQAFAVRTVDALTIEQLLATYNATNITERE